MTIGFRVPKLYFLTKFTKKNQLKFKTRIMYLFRVLSLKRTET